ncbi:MAG: peptide ABC transporter substrate-binding protein [Verrucomicrobia bacterium]|nr:peptide ABC transporter substrate-binding protein [Verrucomicrobiota bacterium]
MRRVFYFYLFFLIFACSCQSKSEVNSSKKTMVRINIGDDPKSLDPRKSRSVAEKNIMCMLFDGLTRLGKEGKNELALAKEVEISEDKLRYTFTLKEAYWSNGDPVVAQDFLYAWKTALSPSFISENAYQLFCIKNAKEIKEGKRSESDLGAYAIGEKVLQIDLEYPVPYFFEYLSSPIFFPVHAKIDATPSICISCGPFILKEWRHNNFIEVLKNERYFDAENVRLSSIYMTMVEQETEIQMFESKELDWAGSPISTLSLDCIKGLKEKKILQSSPMSGTRFFRMNIESELLRNVNIRKALNLAVNRKDIVDHIMQGDQRIALQFFPDSSQKYFQDADIEKAKIFWQKGLEELNITLEKFPKISLLCASSHQNLLIAQAVQQDWKKTFGIDVGIEANEMKVYFSRVGNLDYQIALGSWVADYADPESFLEVFKYKKDPVNNTGWENENYISVLNSAKKLTGNERKEKLLHCESILMQDLPIIPLYHLNNLYLKNPDLKDVFISSIGSLDFKWAYLDYLE